MCYTYDSLNRVTVRTIRNISNNSIISIESFNYDAAGNVTSAPSSSFAYDTNNRLISFNGNAVSYDLDGNMVSNGSFTCTYDSANRLVSAGGHTYTYNAEGVRIRNLCYDADTTYTYDTNCSLSKLLCKTTNDITTKYVYGRGLIGEEKLDEFKTYHFDSRGSTIAITNINGTITDTFAYDTYGKCISHTGDSFVIFGYNGRDGVITDKNGLIYMRARYYSPVMKRFINADIVAGEISNAVTLNRFAYANGNPVSFVDPFGLWSLEDAWDSVTNWVSDTANDVKDWATDAYNGAKETITGAYGAAKDWAIENIIQPVQKISDNVRADIENFNWDNESEATVLSSNYFSAYRGKLVINLPIGNNAFSFGIIFMGTGVPDTEYDTVKHEYGHTVQFDNMGFWNYLTKVGIPSVTGYNLDKNGNLPYDYYTAPWEADADMYGGVSRTPNPKLPPWDPSIGYYDFGDLLRAWLNM